MGTSTRAAPPLPELLEWLHERDVRFHVREHAVTYSARGTALAEGIDPHTFAKAVVVRADDGRRAILVVQATDQVDLGIARRLLNADALHLVTEKELGQLAPGCEVGTMPPVGLWHLPIYADQALRDDPEISFHAGSHAYSVRVDREAWERSAGVVYGPLAREVMELAGWFG